MKKILQLDWKHRLNDKWHIAILVCWKKILFIWLTNLVPILAWLSSPTKLFAGQHYVVGRKGERAGSHLLAFHISCSSLSSWSDLHEIAIPRKHRPAKWPGFSPLTEFGTNMWPRQRIASYSHWIAWLFH